MLKDKSILKSRDVNNRSDQSVSKVKSVYIDYFSYIPCPPALVPDHQRIDLISKLRPVKSKSNSKCHPRF